MDDKFEDRSTRKVVVDGKWEVLSESQKYSTRDKVRAQLRTYREVLKELNISTDPLLALSTAQRILSEVQSSPCDERMAGMVEAAKVHFNSLLHDLEISLPLAESTEERERVNIKIKNRLSHRAAEECRKKEEEERVAIISRLGLKEGTTFKAAKNEMLRLEIIGMLRLPKSTRLQRALKLWDECKLNQYIIKSRLEAEEYEARERQKRERQRIKAESVENEKRRRLGLDGVADIELAEKLQSEVRKSIETLHGYLYLRCWVLRDGSRWYKIGITRDPQRREAEQNILPVPATTIVCVKMASFEHARTAEKAIHHCLKEYRINGAGNKELFSLHINHLASLVAIMKGLGGRHE